MGVYHRLEEQGLERVWSLSDNVFAFAMTLLVLGVRVPDIAHIRSEPDLVAALLALWPRLLTYLLSFLTLGLYWVAQQVQHGLLARVDRIAGWLHLAFLAAVAMTPFSTTLLSAFFEYRAALIVYWLNLALLGGTLHAAWAYSTRAGLVRPDVPEDTVKAIRQRVMRTQALYAIGAALCVVGTTWAIGFMVLVQLNYAFVAPIPWLKRLTR